MKIQFLCFESYFLNSDLRLWLYSKHYEAKALQQNLFFLIDVVNLHQDSYHVYLNDIKSFSEATWT